MAIYFELPITWTFSDFPWRFELSRVNCIMKILVLTIAKWKDIASWMKIYWTQLNLTGALVHKNIEEDHIMQQTYGKANTGW